MEKVKKLNEFEIFKKRSGRHAVVNTKTQKMINGQEKADVLLKAGLIKLTPPKAKEAPAAEAPAAQ